MLSINIDACCSETLGTAHGLNWDAVSAEYTEPTKKAINTLFHSHTKLPMTEWSRLGEQDALFNKISEFAHSKQGQYDDVVVLGIGGSALGAKALLSALRPPLWNQRSTEDRNGFPKLHVLDNVDSDTTQALYSQLNFKRTLFLVISKSGGTIEPMSVLLIALEHLNKEVGTDNLAQHMVIITDPERGLLRPYAQKRGLPVFDIPPNAGGRFSVFTAVGLLPAALCGIDIKAIQQGLQTAQKNYSNPTFSENPLAQVAAVHTAFYKQGKNISVLMPYSTALEHTADWFVQLWAESIGKAKNLDGDTVNVGLTPVKAVGATDQHSQLQLFAEGPYDKVITFIDVEETHHTLTLPTVPEDFSPLSYLGGKTLHDVLRAECSGTQRSLTEGQRANLTITIPKLTEVHYAELLYFFETLTAVTGALFDIDPFNQPGVEASKIITQEILSKTVQAVC